MIYKNFHNLKLSALGFGMMRLPVQNNSDADIDESATAKMIAAAMEQGVNYYDTAWGYHNGQSEVVTGRCLKSYPREQFYLASKFPGYDLSNMGKTEEIFEEQLRKCQVDYFDFYLVHNVCEMNIDAYLNESFGTLSYLRAQKENGRIRHLGFSAHGDYDVMKRFLDAYGKDMEFCQIQLNWLDWSFQNAKEKVVLLNEYKLPIWVMEPLRGGKLANLSARYCTQLNTLRPDETIPAWSFRFLQSIPNVVVTLSGMSNESQMTDNLKTFETERPLTEHEMSSLLAIADDINHHMRVPCTSCHYCVSHCPQGLDIPSLLKLYNEHCFTNGGFLAPMMVSTLTPEKRPDSCIGCRSCEAVCPQQIKISESLQDLCKLISR